MSDLMIGSLIIREDNDGLYSMSDLHTASGGVREMEYSEYLKSTQGIADLAELVAATYYPIHVKKEGVDGGPYFGCQKIFISYALWLGPRMHRMANEAFKDIAPAKAIHDQLKHPIAPDFVAAEVEHQKEIKIPAIQKPKFLPSEAFSEFKSVAITIGMSRGEACIQANIAVRNDYGIDFLEKLGQLERFSATLEEDMQGSEKDFREKEKP